MKNERSRVKAIWTAVIAGIIATLIVLSQISELIVEWLWMKQLGYAGIFLRLLATKWILFAVTFILVFFFFWINLRFILKNVSRFAGKGDFNESIKDMVRIVSTRSGIILPVLSSAGALLFGLSISSRWDTYFRFSESEVFGRVEPIFNMDIGFYVFRLPFYELIQNTLLVMTLAGLVIVLASYIFLGAVQLEGKQITKTASYTAAMRHISIVFLLVLAATAWGFYLDRFQLLYSARGAVYGAGYTDVHVVVIGLWVMLLASAVLGGLVASNLVLQRHKMLYIGLGTYVLMYFLAIVLLPAITQKFIVQPNELELETLFIKYNIELTRAAYQLDLIEEKNYSALADLSLEEVSQNQETIRNIRLWDWRPIRQTFRQTQEIRLYYKFYEVDVDRYHLDGAGYRQVMLSARELTEQLPLKARTWVNQYLQYTHGYGLAMSLVSEKVKEGLPEYIVKDLPPVARYTDIENPAIYYGEKMPGYRIVNTEVKEFDYPKGDENVYTRYRGNGGIMLDSIWKRILFAWEMSDVNILISSYITPESRIQFWRKVQDRVSRVAPFLELDTDPYLVVSEGKLYWIQDAYTTSSEFPYAEPYRTGVNYIRNSVKIIVDAYEGSVSFYVADPDDPVLRVYRKTFPGVFKDLEELSSDLKAHLRYPESLFSIQVEKFKTYHMTIPQVFYNREDLWTLPQEKYAGSPVQMEPYYILMRLPDEQSLQYIIMTPLTPENRDNMIAWVTAKSDFPDYGKVVVYKLPKERLIYGPIQIEAMIDQDDVISQQLSLWDQRGSKVIRGNLLVIPVNHSFLYVEPVYLIAEQTDIPQLKRVIVVYGKNVVMEETLQQAVETAFGVRRPQSAIYPEAVKEISPDMLFQLREYLDKAEKAIGEGDWTGFGTAMESLKQLLSEPSEKTGDE